MLLTFSVGVVGFRAWRIWFCNCELYIGKSFSVRVWAPGYRKGHVGIFLNSVIVHPISLYENSPTNYAGVQNGVWQDLRI